MLTVLQMIYDPYADIWTWDYSARVHPAVVSKLSVEFHINGTDWFGTIRIGRAIPTNCRHIIT
jgi:hypothetical protein